MADSADDRIKTLNKELEGLKTKEAGLFEQLTKLDDERRVLQDMAHPSQQLSEESAGGESGPARTQPDPVNAAMARERLDKVQSEIDGTRTAYGQTQAAIADTDAKLDIAHEDKKVEVAVENYDKEVADVGSRTENAASTIEVANLADAATHGAAFGGTFEALDIGIPSAQLRDIVEYGKVAHDYQATKDSIKIVGDDLFHQQQLAEIDALRGQIDERMSNAEKVMESTMGTNVEDMNVNAQREFYSNEYGMAFQQLEQLRAGQEQQREAFFATNNAILPDKIVEQQQHRAGLNEELHAHQYGLSRELAAEQATINVDLSNQQMLEQNQSRLERQNAPAAEIEKQTERLAGLQQNQFQNDVYMEANKIQSQNSPQLYQNPPTMNAPGVTAGSPPAPAAPAMAAPAQQGPPPPGM